MPASLEYVNPQLNLNPNINKMPNVFTESVEEYCSVRTIRTVLILINYPRMKSVIITIALFVVVANAQTYYVAEDEFGEPFVMVPLPLIRQRRQTSVDITGGRGTTITAGHQGTIFQNGNHQVTGGGFVSKQFHPKGPTTLGGNVGYQHVPSGSGLNVGASNTRGFGTDLSATGNANIWSKGNSRLDATGNYGRHYGGPGGTGKPNWGVGLNFNHRF